MKLNALTFLILALASFRVTRLVVLDTIFEGARARVHTWLYNQSQKKFGLIFSKLLDLVSCTWCSGVWISGGIYWIWSTYGLTWYLILAAIAGAQGLIHAYEPE